MFLTVTGFREHNVRQYSVLRDVEPNQRGMSRARQATDSAISRQFLDKIEKAPSNYCRKSTSKIYLEPLVKTKTQLYKLYCSAAQDASLKPLCYTTFKDFFTENNYSLIKPKKDMRDTCLSYRCGNLPRVW